MFYFVIIKNDDGDPSIGGLYTDPNRAVAKSKAVTKARELREKETDDLVTYEVREATGSSD